MQKHDFLESVPLYALDALQGVEKQRLQEHLEKGCELCESELRVYAETGSRLPYSLPNSPLPPQLKEQIWSKIQAEVPSKNRMIWPWIAVAAAIAIAVFTGWWISQMNRQIAQSNTELVDLRKELLQQRKEIEWLRDPSVQLALLTGLEPAPQARGKIVWNPQASRGLFYVNSLPKISSDKSYQLWVIGNAGPVSAGVFSIDAKGGAVVTITRIEGTAQGSLQFAVTIEPSGGVPKPTGSMVLAGKPL